MIDVIIPAYNAHKTIDKTLISIALDINDDTFTLITTQTITKPAIAPPDKPLLFCLWKGSSCRFLHHPLHLAYHKLFR